ncbi:hypothetical protein OUZ56_028490 [Daphnia magna]|uniref:Uncharacterized protein n=1 Tax=Daphnia magna TaxID=35525 RepID=A0ABR0B460_9CRUS|nr:hypothetical protein OUZ56_028490 [Daphnia magna]
MPDASLKMFKWLPQQDLLDIRTHDFSLHTVGCWVLKKQHTTESQCWACHLETIEEEMLLKLKAKDGDGNYTGTKSTAYWNKLKIT